ncbi:phage tail protein [Pseudomonas sp. BIOMIG1BAC]|uniref:phage tail assembly chaperone n=2 Tax=unclassified Pseudomonas TaxID=196821 RepID=UPI0013E184D8|nr:phage tail assembly chaperone [Pseudomonas sp. BIOMIG1BAC]QIH07168.1 phage tail protein [Pseudomonas sp. BIOMIG1BAC]
MASKNRLYSQTTQTTYLKGIHSDIPTDAVEISEELYLKVIGNPPPGKIREHDEKGLPYLVDALPDRQTVERAWRDGEFAGVLWLRERHRDQLEVSANPTLSVEQFQELLTYIQALRDWPQSKAFPDTDHRPNPPPWLAEQTR